jgi:hypothetical protein
MVNLQDHTVDETNTAKQAGREKNCTGKDLSRNPSEICMILIASYVEIPTIERILETIHVGVSIRFV